MIKEIGSDFWDIPICKNHNSIFPEDTKWFLSGRTALKYIIQDFGIKSICLPEWCCESMILPFMEFGVKVGFYKEDPSTVYEAILLIDYFGYTDQSRRPDNYRGIVIRDLTHSIFSKKYDDADCYFGSLRKWAGFCTGGFAWGTWKKNLPIPAYNETYVSIRKEAMKQKKRYINGIVQNKDYLRVFKQADEFLKTCGICAAFDEDIMAAKYLNVESLKSTRRKNAKVLLDKFDGLFNLKENDCPLCVPISIHDRDRLRLFLIKNEIYCPIHWPERDINGTELSLVCDQRYGEEDMLRICRTIENFQIEESIKQ